MRLPTHCTTWVPPPPVKRWSPAGNAAMNIQAGGNHGIEPPRLVPYHVWKTVIPSLIFASRLKLSQEKWIFLSEPPLHSLPWFWGKCEKLVTVSREMGKVDAGRQVPVCDATQPGPLGPRMTESNMWYYVCNIIYDSYMIYIICDIFYVIVLFRCKTPHPL